MKSLIDFLTTHNYISNTHINEHIIKGHLKRQYKKYIDFPVLTGSIMDGYKFEKYRQIKIGKGPFYIYRDIYHNKLHIASLSDMESIIGFNYDDFEDFSEKDIIADFKTLKDAVKYMLNENGISEKNIENIEKGHAGFNADFIEDNHGTKNYYDKDDFAYKVLTGVYTDKDYLSYAEDNENIIGSLSMVTNVTGVPK